MTSRETVSFVSPRPSTRPRPSHKFAVSKYTTWWRARRKLGCVPLGWSGSGSVIQDHSDHRSSKEPKNPWPEWIHWFLWCTIIRVILVHWCWSRSPQRNAPLNLLFPLEVSEFRPWNVTCSLPVGKRIWVGRYSNCSCFQKLLFYFDQKVCFVFPSIFVVSGEVGRLNSYGELILVKVDFHRRIIWRWLGGVHFTVTAFALIFDLDKLCCNFPLK